MEEFYEEKRQKAKQKTKEKPKQKRMRRLPPFNRMHPKKVRRIETKSYLEENSDGFEDDDFSALSKVECKIEKFDEEAESEAASKKKKRLFHFCQNRFCNE